MSDDWTNGPAKWAAVVVLGGASIFGLVWSAATRASVGVSAPVPFASPVRPVAPASQPVTTQPEPAPPPSASAAAAPATRRININTATASELELLPGIGPAMAGRILEYRNKNGRFRSVDELDEVKGIGPRTLEKLRPLVRVE